MDSWLCRFSYLKAGNEDLALELSRWVFKLKGVLKVGKVVHKKLSSPYKGVAENPPDVYTIEDQIVSTDGRGDMTVGWMVGRTRRDGRTEGGTRGDDGGDAVAVVEGGKSLLSIGPKMLAVVGVGVQYQTLFKRSSNNIQV